MRKVYSLFFLFIFCVCPFPQKSDNLIYVDKEGRIRWTSNNEEAYFLGVNYYYNKTFYTNEELYSFLYLILFLLCFTCFILTQLYY